MKKSFAFAAVLAATFSSAVAAPRQFTATVVADAPSAVRSSPSYALYDGGFIEGGDSIAGETPPAPDAVRRAVAQAAQTAGFTAAADKGAADMLLIYHWGGLRPDSTPRARSFHIEPNLRARIALVASARTLRKAEDFFRGPRPPYVEPDLRDAFELSHDASYFVIVSAYESSALARHEEKPLWRVRVSSLTNAGSMAEVVPALASAAGPYLARDLARPTHIKLSTTPVVAPATSAAAPVAEPDDFVRSLARHEHEVFSGEADPTDS
jgi:hypothetical protein